MAVVFIGPRKFSIEKTGGQRRFLEAISCFDNGCCKVLSGFWEVSRGAIERKATTYIAFDERYLFVGILLLMLRKRVVFFPRGNKLVHFKYSYGVCRLYLYKKLFSWLYSKCDLLVFQTHAQALEFQNIYSYRGRFEVLHNNINVSWLEGCEEEDNARGENERAGSYEATEPRVIGFMGGLDKRKGFDIAYEALSGLVSDGKIKLHVAGAEHSKFEGYNVVPYGYLSGKELVEFYRECDFIIIPSEYDSFPNVLLEAIAYGAIPLVSRDAITEDILGSDSVLLFERTHDGIKNHIKRMTSQAGLVAYARSECAQLKEKYTFDWCGRIRDILRVSERETE